MSTAVTKQIWDTLVELSPEDVCRRGNITYQSHESAYILRAFSYDIHISLEKRQLWSCSAGGQHLLNELGSLSRLAVICYLLNAQELPLSGKLVKPSDLPGGPIYEQGSHVLPIEKIAEKYAHDAEGFMTRGLRLGGKRLEYGDVSVCLYPFPRIPVSILLWEADDEFASRASILLDYSCRFQLPADILWSTMAMTADLMLLPVLAD